jgi:uncharacterized protein YggU (UPF0235/DUF167 family)
MPSLSFSMTSYYQNEDIQEMLNLKHIAKLLGISVSQLEITHGQTTRDKRVRALV